MAITQYIKHFGLIHVWACCIQILCLIWDYKHCTTAQEPVFSMTDWFVKLDSYKVWMIFCTAQVLINCHSSIEIAIVYLHRSFPHIVYTVHMTNSNLIELDCFWDLINPCKLLSFQSLSLFWLLISITCQQVHCALQSCLFWWNTYLDILHLDVWRF